MGSYHGTCGISQLPIMEGDNIVVYPLIERQIIKSGGYFTSTNNYYKVLSLGLHGVYNGYGSVIVEDKEDDMLTDILNNIDGLSINPNYMSIKDFVIESPYRNGNTISSFIAGVRDKSLKGFSYMMIKESVYYDLIELISSQRYMYGKDIWADKLTNDLRDYVDVNSDYQRIVFGKNSNSKEKREAINELVDMESFNLIKEHLCKGGQFYLGKYLVTSSHVEKIGQKVKDYILIDEAMSQLRKWWAPQNGAGSQRFDVATYKELSKSIDDTIREYEYD